MAMFRSTSEGPKITKEDLVAAGLDPDKIKEFQDKGVTKDELTALQTSLEASNKSAFDEIRASILELSGKIAPKVTPRADPNTPTADELREQRSQEFLEDPTGFIDKANRNVIGAAAVEFKRMSRDLAFKEGQRTMKAFGNATLAAEIKAEWDKYTPEKMAQFNTDPELLLKQIHSMVMGNHHDEIVADRDKKDGKFNLVQAGSSGSSFVDSSNNERRNNSDELTDEEKTQARKFGMTEKEWLDEKKGISDDAKYIQSGGREVAA